MTALHLIFVGDSDMGSNYIVTWDPGLGHWHFSNSTGDMRQRHATLTFLKIMRHQDTPPPPPPPSWAPLALQFPGRYTEGNRHFCEYFCFFSVKCKLAVNTYPNQLITLVIWFIMCRHVKCLASLPLLYTKLVHFLSDFYLIHPIHFNSIKPQPFTGISYSHLRVSYQEI